MCTTKLYGTLHTKNYTQQTLIGVEAFELPVVW